MKVCKYEKPEWVRSDKIEESETTEQDKPLALVGIRCPNCGGKNIEPEIEKIYYQEFSHKCLDCEYKFCVSGDDINVKNSKLFP